MFLDNPMVKKKDALFGGLYNRHYPDVLCRMCGLVMKLEMLFVCQTQSEQ
jgi:hypothetical protein